MPVGALRRGEYAAKQCSSYPLTSMPPEHPIVKNTELYQMERDLGTEGKMGLGLLD